MRHPSGRYLVFLVLLFAPVMPLRADECTLSDPSSCTILEFYDLSWQEARAADAPRKELASEALTATQRAVVGANIAGTSPSPFASRVHSSYQDFLNLFDFALNSVEESEDGKELVLRLNPISSGSNRLGLSLTLREPAIFAPLKDSIPQAIREETVTQLEDQQDDIDDQTWSLAYTRESKTCGLDGSGWCWGRSPAIYRDALSRALRSIYAGSPEEAPDNFALKADIGRLVQATGVQDVTAIRLSTLPGDVRIQVVEKIRAWAAAHAALTTQEQAYYAKFDFEQIASLMDNQPQLTGTVSYHKTDDLGGPSESDIALEFQVGARNLNSLAHDCGGTFDSCLVSRLTHAPKESGTSKFVFGLSYKRVDAYTMDALDANGPVPGFVPLDIDRSSQASVRLQWGAHLPAKVMGREPRFDFALEGWRTYSDDLRNESRLTATATLAVPLGYDLTIPFSLTYANNPEFLDEHGRSLGLHFGLSYRLPWESDRGSR